MTSAVNRALTSASATGGVAQLYRPQLWSKTVLIIGLAACASAFSPEQKAAPALAITAATLGSIFLLPALRRIPSHVYSPVLGAIAIIGVSYASASFWGIELPRLTGAVVRRELTSHLGVLVLILALAYLSLSLDESGFFDWCSWQIMRLAQGNGPRLLVYLFAGVSTLTFFTSNDIVILSVTPILIHLGRNARLTNLTPFLFAQFIAANTASMGLYIGNPTNVVIGSAVGIGFLDYAQRMLIPTIVAVSTALAVVWLLFGRLSRVNRIPEGFELPPAEQQPGWNRQMTVKVTLFGLCLLVLGVLGTPLTVARLFELSDKEGVRERTSELIVYCSLLFAAVALCYDLLRHRQQGSRRATAGEFRTLRRLPVEIVPFFLGFCIILRGLEDAGLTRLASELVVKAFEAGPVAGSLATGFLGIAAVNTTNNLPATILFEKSWLGNPAAHPPIIGLEHRLSELNPAFGDIFIDSSLYASNFGANLTFIGALAGLMWFRMMKDATRKGPGFQRLPTAREFFLYGLLIVPVVTAITCSVIGMRRCLIN